MNLLERKRRRLYLLLICLLAVITYLDRVCISVAGPRMQDALHIPPDLWGWVGTAFLLGYGLFEIPSGHFGDRLGARRVLARIVVWWSAFTALTGTVSSVPVLLLTRFMFGAGEAGALPNAGVAVSNWFGPAERGRAFGMFAMCTQIGGALSPLLVVPMQQALGWRASFFVFGVFGIVWAIIWFTSYRDEGPYSTPEMRHSAGGSGSWKPLLRSRDLWALMTLTFCYVYTLGFFQTWLHTYLVRGRGFTERALAISALPYLCGAAANISGGLVCDFLAKRVGLTWSRRAVGMAGLLISGLGMGTAGFASSRAAVIALLSLGYAGLTFQQPVVFTACLDLGGRRGGAVTGFMNTAGQFGAAISSVVFGYLVSAYKSYEVPLIPMAVLLGVGALLWGKVDPAKPIDLAPE